MRERGREGGREKGRERLCLCGRPVKVIRLVSRHSVEEIVLQRSLAKLELTNTVIEGGQVKGHKLTVYIICSISVCLSVC